MSVTDSKEDLSHQDQLGATGESIPMIKSVLKPVDKMTVKEIKAELSNKGCSIEGKKEVLIERLVTARKEEPPLLETFGDEKVSSTPRYPSYDQSEFPSNMMLFFTMMRQQQEAERDASERRFQLQMEQIRQTAQEDR